MCIRDRTYTGITSLGFPFLILTTGGSNLIRADGSPRFSMMCTLTGAVLNTILDPLFIFGFHMGMAGAALATIIGQIISGIMVIVYLTRFKTVRLSQMCIRDSPVDVEFAVTSPEEGIWRLNLLQCRPLQTAKSEQVHIPDGVDHEFLFDVRRTSMRRSKEEPIDYIVWVDPQKYYEYELSLIHI